MVDFIIDISRRRLLSKMIAVVFLTFTSMFMFPIRYSRTGTLNVVLLLSCILIGVILGAVYRLSWIKVSVLTIISCVVGLGLRIWLEWGEYTLDKELTTLNVLFTYIPIIAVVLVSYFATINSKQYLKALLVENDIINGER